MTTSKSPLSVAVTAYAAAKLSLPLYSNKFSRKTFSLPQLAAMLALKEFFNKDYRGIASIIQDSSDIRAVLELKSAPHFTTLQKTEAKLFKKKVFIKLLKSVLELTKSTKLASKKVRLAAVDSTGLESRHISRYYVIRRHFALDSLQKARYQKYPKAGILSNTENHLILAGLAERGPKFDLSHLKPLLNQATQASAIKTLVADAGYDSEKSHRLLREGYGIRSIIPPRMGRRTHKLPSGKYRRLMAQHFDSKAYGQRWQVETVFSMIKRLQGSFLRARTYWSQCRETLLRLFTHNVMIVVPGV
jgi:hypothetical protein